MERHQRLRKRTEFQRVLATRRLYAGRAFSAFALSEPAEGPQGDLRIGISASRRLRGAVAKNRARRRLREVARLVLLPPDSPLRQAGIRTSVVLIAREAALAVSMAELQAEAGRVLELGRPR